MGVNKIFSTLLNKFALPNTFKIRKLCTRNKTMLIGRIQIVTVYQIQKDLSLEDLRSLLHCNYRYPFNKYQAK